MLTYPWKCTVLHCNHLGNTWKTLVLMTRHFDYWPSASEGDNQRVRSSAPVVSRCFLGGYHVKMYISRGRLAKWLLALNFLHSVVTTQYLYAWNTVMWSRGCSFLYLSAKMRICKQTFHLTQRVPSSGSSSRQVCTWWNGNAVVTENIPCFQ